MNAIVNTETGEINASIDAKTARLMRECEDEITGLDIKIDTAKTNLKELREARSQMVDTLRGYVRGEQPTLDFEEVL